MENKITTDFYRVTRSHPFTVLHEVEKGQDCMYNTYWLTLGRWRGVICIRK